MNASDQVSGPEADSPETGDPAAGASRSADHAPSSAAQEWDERYRERERIWSGNVNPTLAAAVEQIERTGPHRPGEPRSSEAQSGQTCAGPHPACPRALDLGCGEGGDVLWLAQRGYTAFGVDISTVAIGRARARAEELGLTNRVHVQAANLEHWSPNQPGFELITASFFQSYSGLDRTGVLQRAATWLAPGGSLVLLSHAAPPSWATEEDAHGRRMEFPSGESERAMLAELLADRTLVVQREELITREVTGHHGHDGTLTDLLMVCQRIR